jgi:hypothetical protein
MKRAILTILMLGILAGPAYAIGPMTFHTFGHQAGSSWDSWDEKEQGGLATDQDGDGTDDTFVCMFDNPTANGNDTGAGIVSGTDLVLTQNGGIVGAHVAPPTYRTIDGVDDYFLTTNGLWNSTIAGVSNTWTFILKLYYDSSDLAQYIVENVGAGSANAHLRLNLGGATNRLLVCEMDDLVFGSDIRSTANDCTLDQPIYIVAWCDGKNARAGFTTQRPFKFSHFSTGNYVTMANCYNSFGTGFGLQIGGRASFFTGRLYYVIMSKKCLIDTGR